jgi:hypothetical protein
MATPRQRQDSGSAEFQVVLLVGVDDDERGVTPEALDQLGHRLAAALELGAELLHVLEPLGWRAHLSAEGGAVSTWLEKTASPEAVHADLRGLPTEMYARLLEYLPMLARRESDLDELRPTENGFEPYKLAAQRRSTTRLAE